MSTTRTITLACDHSTSSSSRACEQSFVTDVEKVGEAREAAASNGWTHKGGDDYCAIHADDAEGAA